MPVAGFTPETKGTMAASSVPSEVGFPPLRQSATTARKAIPAAGAVSTGATAIPGLVRNAGSVLPLAKPDARSSTSPCSARGLSASTGSIGR
jgi:hypothetical protein